MACSLHTDRDAVVSCHECGRVLCSECAEKFQPPMCIYCAQAHASEIKSEMIKNIILSVILMVVGIVITKNPMGFLLAGIPYGWSILNSITPAMFIWMPWVGWLIYFGIKLVLSYIIGIVALPIKIIRWISELKRVKNVEESLM